VVADVASQIFGEAVQTEKVIGETLRRSTKQYDFGEAAVVDELRRSGESENGKISVSARVNVQLTRWPRRSRRSWRWGSSRSPMR